MRHLFHQALSFSQDNKGNEEPQYRRKQQTDEGPGENAEARIVSLQLVQQWLQAR